MKNDKPYCNNGNELVISLIPPTVKTILDIGCGDGGNARRLKEKMPDISVIGVTHNPAEAELARPFMSAVYVLDVEEHDLSHLTETVDLVLFSHVLEHLREPTEVIRRILPSLSSNGYLLIAVPNLLEWRTRWQLLLGRFEYADHGVLDRTHLRFFTCRTASTELLAPFKELRLVMAKCRGGVPLGPLRHRWLPPRARALIDAAGLRYAPNLFAGEIALLAQMI